MKKGEQAQAVKGKDLKKVRKMKGVKPGRGSAGRSNASLNGKGRRDGDTGRAGIRHRCDNFRDVDCACRLWLAAHDVPCGGFREVMMAALRRGKS